MWIHDLAGDIGFYQMSLSQSESTILHENMIYKNIFIIIFTGLYLHHINFLNEANMKLYNIDIHSIV